MKLLAQSLITQANGQVVAPLNLIEGICACRIMEFLTINPPEFSGSKVE